MAKHRKADPSPDAPIPLVSDVSRDLDLSKIVADFALGEIAKGNCQMMDTERDDGLWIAQSPKPAALPSRGAFKREKLDTSPRTIDTQALLAALQVEPSEREQVPSFYIGLEQIQQLLPKGNIDDAHANRIQEAVDMGLGLVTGPLAKELNSSITVCLVIDENDRVKGFLLQAHDAQDVESVKTTLTPEAIGRMNATMDRLTGSVGAARN